MNPVKNLFILSVCLLTFNTLTFAQDRSAFHESDTLYLVETQDGNEFIGRILEMTKDEVTMELEDKTRVKFSQNYIVRIEKVKRKRDQRWYEGVHTTGYFIANSGYGLPKGESYYKNVWVLYNEFNYGFTKNLSMSAGMVPLFLFAGAPTPVWVTPRVTFPLAKDVVNVGAGATIGGIIGEGSAFFTMVFGNVTFGPRNKNLSVGVGYFAIGNDTGAGPAFNLNGLLQVSKNTFLMMENYIFISEGAGAVFSILGGRTMIKKVALDYGLMLPFVTDQDTFFAIPWLGVTIPFKGKSK